MGLEDDVRVRLSAEGEAQVVAALRKVVTESNKMGRDGARGVGQLNSALAGTKTLLASLATAVSVGSLIALGKAGADAADGIGKASQRAGDSVKNMSALSFAAKTADVDFEKLQKSMAIFAKNVTALERGDKTQAGVFGALGLTAESFAGKGAAERFALTAQALSRLKDSQEKAALSQAAFGKQGASLIPLFNDLEDGIEGAIKKAQQFGVLLTDDTAKASQAINDDFTIIREQVVAGAARFIEGLAPGLHAALGTVQEDLADNQDAWKTWGASIGAFIGTSVLVAEASFDRIVTSLRKVGNAAKATGGLIGGAITAAFTGNLGALTTAIAEAQVTTEQNKQLEADFDKRQQKRLERAEKIGEAVAKGVGGLPALRGGRQDEDAPVVPSGKTAAELEKKRLDAVKRLEQERARLIDKQLEAEGKRHEVALRNIAEESAKLDETLRALEAKGVPQPEREAQVAAFRDALTRAETFRQVSEEGTRALNQLKSDEDVIESKIDRHLVTQAEGHKELAAIEAERLPALRDIAASMLAAAEALGSPEAIAAAQQFAASLDQIGQKSQQATSLLAKTAKVAKQELGDAIKSSLEQGIREGQKFITVLQNIGAQVAAALASFYLTKTLASIGLGVPGAKTGGLVRAAEGGVIEGPGTGTSDSILARVSNGEFIMNAAAVARIGVPLLHALNSGMRAPALGGFARARRFADGGLVSGAGAESDSASLTVGLEEGLVLRKLKTAGARRVIIQELAKEPRALSAALGRR